MADLRVRVVRIMEYDFPNITAAESTKANSSVPFTGIKMFGNTLIRSAEITTIYESDESDDNDRH